MPLNMIQLDKIKYHILNAILIPSLFFLPITVNANPAMTGGTDPDIVLDTQTNPHQNTSLDNAQNGVEIININTPTSNGISINYFSDFKPLKINFK